MTPAHYDCDAAIKFYPAANDCFMHCGSKGHFGFILSSRKKIAAITLASVSLKEFFY